MLGLRIRLGLWLGPRLGMGMGRLVESLVGSMVVGSELDLVGTASGLLLSAERLSVGTAAIWQRAGR
jgi:hypothetical protein